MPNKEVGAVMLKDTTDCPQSRINRLETKFLAAQEFVDAYIQQRLLGKPRGIVLSELQSRLSPSVQDFLASSAERNSLEILLMFEDCFPVSQDAN